MFFGKLQQRVLSEEEKKVSSKMKSLEINSGIQKIEVMQRFPSEYSVSLVVRLFLEKAEQLLGNQVLSLVILNGKVNISENCKHLKTSTCTIARSWQSTC